MEKYVLDSNFFIQAHRKVYPLDVAVNFWNKLEALATSSKIISIDKVWDELNQNDDELTQWCKAHLPNGFFKDTSSMINAYTAVTGWAFERSDQFQKRAIDTFLAAEEADAWIISYALDTKCVLVTNEVSAPNSKTSIKIPDVCLTFDIRYLDTIDMFRDIRETF